MYVYIKIALMNSKVYLFLLQAQKRLFLNRLHAENINHTVSLWQLSSNASALAIMCTK